jgi:c-di-GMP-binding flagellar brake protein YcgR
MSHNPKIPVGASEIEVGKPLPWPIYDEHGVLLLNAGVAPVSQNQVAALVARGPYRGSGHGQRQTSASGRTTPLVGIGVPVGAHRKSGPEGDPIPFDDLALQPSEVLQIHPALEVVGDFLPVVLLGYLKNQTIITTNPVVAGKVLPVKEGSPYNIKAFSGTNLFTFRTKVLKTHTHPLSHLHFEYPRLVYSTKIRKALRAIVELPAMLYDPSTNSATSVVLKDLSVGGARLILPQPTAEKEDRFALSFKIKIADDLEEEVRTDVIVRSLDTQENKGLTVHTMGVQFQDLPKEAKLLVMTLVYRQQSRKG